MIRKDIIDLFRVPVGKKVKLKDYSTGVEAGRRVRGTREERDQGTRRGGAREEPREPHRSPGFALRRQPLLAAARVPGDGRGRKDGTIKHVMSGVNPQGCQVFNFKKPSSEDLQHNYLWRYMKCLPERGRIGIINRSYYEDVLVVKVHPKLLGRQLPREKEKVGKKFWDARYEDINAFEQHLVRNGTVILKFYLNVSKDEQKRRFLERLDRSEKNWKFSPSDLAERGFWDDYMGVYEDAITATSTEAAPWYIIPADYKWITRSLVADIVTTAIQNLGLKYPEVTPEQKLLLAEARKKLDAE